MESAGRDRTGFFGFFDYFDVSALRAEIYQILAKSSKSYFSYLLDLFLICLMSRGSDFPCVASRILHS